MPGFLANVGPHFFKPKRHFFWLFSVSSKVNKVQSNSYLENYQAKEAAYFHVAKIFHLDNCMH